MSNTFGRLFSVTTFGESHGEGVGAVIDGCPARLELRESDIQPQLDRRRPGQSELTTPRDEPDRVTILCGVENGVTLGTPIAMLVRNDDRRPQDYGAMANVPRPSHADFTYRAKYGITASSGGGRASARETIGRVTAGSVAAKWLRVRHGVEIVAWVSAIGGIRCEDLSEKPITRADVDRTLVRCPDARVAEEMAAEVLKAKDEQDSVGGVITCVCRNLPAGWGEPVFGKLHGLLAGAMLSIPATKGFEIGSGFAGSRMRGSAHNDMYVRHPDGRIGTATNRSGGVQGGISTGEPIVFRVAFKPPATIGKPQQTVDYAGSPAVMEARGRHDPCVVPRAVPIVESMAALVLADAALLAAARS